GARRTLAHLVTLGEHERVGYTVGDALRKEVLARLEDRPAPGVVRGREPVLEFVLGRRAAVARIKIDLEPRADGPRLPDVALVVERALLEVRQDVKEDRAMNPAAAAAGNRRQH